jgi:5-methylcytosine-specific restriction enzyme subunit McrC
MRARTLGRTRQALKAEFVVPIYSVTEFARIRSGTPGGGSLVDRLVPAELLQELATHFAVDDQAGDNSRKGVLRWHGDRSGRPCLRAGSHIGILQAPTGALEILPKLAQPGGGLDLQDEGDAGNLRHVVQHMLATVMDMPFRETGVAAQGRYEDTLFEWFIARFLDKVLRVVRRGIRSSYETLEDNLSVLRGRLVLVEHLRRNAADASRLFVRFDEFTPNRPENRLIHAALIKAVRASGDLENRRLGRELMAAFADVPPSTDVASDFKDWRLERGALHYDGMRDWCSALLAPFSTTPTRGDLNFESFLFPAEVLFERYVAARLRQALSRQPRDQPRATLTEQAQERSLFNGDGPFGRRYGNMRPDIVVRRGNELLICDTKWKLYEEGERGQGVAQADLYQLFAYGRFWQQAQGPAPAVQLALIAPKSSALAQVTGPHVFGDGRLPPLQLWLIPYDLMINFGSILCDPPQGSLLHDVIGWHQQAINHQRVA